VLALFLRKTRRDSWFYLFCKEIEKKKGVKKRERIFMGYLFLRVIQQPLHGDDDYYSCAPSRGGGVDISSSVVVVSMDRARVRLHCQRAVRQ
jgi:hypothetical protein